MLLPPDVTPNQAKGRFIKCGTKYLLRCLSIQLPLTIATLIF